MVHRRSRLGFTLIELLVVIAIIGVLIALLLPAVQADAKSDSLTSIIYQRTDYSDVAVNGLALVPGGAGPSGISSSNSYMANVGSAQNNGVPISQASVSISAESACDHLDFVTVLEHEANGRSFAYAKIVSFITGATSDFLSAVAGIPVTTNQGTINTGVKRYTATITPNQNSFYAGVILIEGTYGWSGAAFEGRSLQLLAVPFFDTPILPGQWELCGQFHATDAQIDFWFDRVANQFLVQGFVANGTTQTWIESGPSQYLSESFSTFLTPAPTKYHVFVHWVRINVAAMGTANSSYGDWYATIHAFGEAQQ